MYQETLENIKSELDRSRLRLQEAKSDLELRNQVRRYSDVTTSNLSIELISVHVPKTAGTLLRNIWAQIYSHEHCFWDYTPYLEPTNFFKNLELIQSKHKVIHGHTAGRWIHMFPNAKKIIWLRNPVARIISEYYFVISHSLEDWEATPGSELNQQIIEKKLGIESYIEMPAIQNSMYKHCYLKGDPKSLAEAYNFVGIHEFFVSDYASLIGFLGKPNIRLWKENTNKYPKYQVELKKLVDDKRLLGKIAYLNKQDMELYKVALELRCERQGLSPSRLINSLEVPINVC
jgi:Sulfotransferase family